MKLQHDSVCPIFERFFLVNLGRPGVMPGGRSMFASRKSEIGHLRFLRVLGEAHRPDSDEAHWPPAATADHALCDRATTSVAATNTAQRTDRCRLSARHHTGDLGAIMYGRIRRESALLGGVEPHRRITVLRPPARSTLTHMECALR